MKIEIDIDKYIFERITKNLPLYPTIVDDISDAIKNGTPLHKEQQKGFAENDISKEKVEEIRRYLIDNVFRNPTIMFDDNIRGYDDKDLDLIAIICDLYEYIHVLVYGKKYDYMFHWANKCGSWIETGEFDAVIEEIMKEKEIKSNEENRDN